MDLGVSSFCIPGDLLASFLCLFWEPKSFFLEEKMKTSVSCEGLGLAGGICPPAWAAPACSPGVLSAIVHQGLWGDQETRVTSD